MTVNVPRAGAPSLAVTVCFERTAPPRRSSTTNVASKTLAVPLTVKVSGTPAPAPGRSRRMTGTNAPTSARVRPGASRHVDSLDRRELRQRVDDLRDLGGARIVEVDRCSAAVDRHLCVEPEGRQGGACDCLRLSTVTVSARRAPSTTRNTVSGIVWVTVVVVGSLTVGDDWEPPPQPASDRASPRGRDGGCSSLPSLAAEVRWHLSLGCEPSRNCVARCGARAAGGCRVAAPRSPNRRGSAAASAAPEAASAPAGRRRR